MALMPRPKISTDALSYGLGACYTPCSDHNGSWKHVAYSSRTLPESEYRYAQIEKEALVTTWAYKKAVNYTF